MKLWEKCGTMTVAILEGRDGVFFAVERQAYVSPSSLLLTPAFGPATWNIPFWDSRVYKYWHMHLSVCEWTYCQYSLLVSEKDMHFVQYGTATGTPYTYTYIYINKHSSTYMYV